MKIKSIINKIPDYLIAQLLSLSFVLALTSSLGLTYPNLSTYLLILAATSLFAVAFANRTTLLVSGSVLGFALIVLACILLFRTGFDKVYVFFDDYFYWLSDFIENAGVPDAFYQTLTVVSVSLVISLINYLFIVKKLFFHVLLIAGSALFTIQWSYGLCTTLLPFYLFLPAILILYFRYVYKRKAAESSHEYVGTGYFTVWAVPVCMLAIILAAAFHTNDKPLEWKWLDTKINSIYNLINKRFDYESFDYFSVSSSGFGSKDDILGGRVRLNRTSVLSVDTPRNVYLKGIAKDVYTGTKWTVSNPEKNQIGSDLSSLYGDTDEMVTGMKLLTSDSGFINKLFYKDKVSVVFQNLRTKSLFMPELMKAFAPAGKPIQALTDANGSLSVPERLNKGFGYSVELYSPKVGSKEFADALRKSRIGLYADNLADLQSSSFLSSASEGAADNTDKSSGSENDMTVFYSAQGTDSGNNLTVRVIDYSQIEKLNKLNDKARAIEQKYMQLPDSLPQRVRDLAVSITSGSDTQYDKVKAIEKYLSSNFPYNLDVRSTPRNRDFVDYFLFDLKQGYCTYYASAMTVLARCAGIPARYVEGYILPPKPVKEDSTTYIVTNMQAHAWAEVYFEGYGWLSFEATSPFMSNFYSDDTISASISSDYNPAYQDYMDLIRRYTEGRDTGADIEIPDMTVEKPNYLLYVLTGLGVLVLIFLAVLFTNLFRSKLKLFRILSLSPKDCILKLYEYYLNILTLQGILIQGGETPFQYSERVDKTLFFDPFKFRAVTDIFVKYRYGKDEASDKEKQLISDFMNPFIREVRNNMGKMRFFLMKCILGRI